ncbi:MAG: hypothetical protein ABJH04_12185 [Cyclobacteriaceae bacterium]
MKRAVLAGMMLLAFMMSCEDATEISEQGTETTEVVAFVESVFAQSSIDVDDVVTSNTSSSGRGGHGSCFGFSDCLEVTKVDTDGGYPKTITMDYGDGCTSNEVTKSGLIVVTVTGSRHEAGSQRVVTYEDYSVNGYVFNGTEVFTYNGNKAYTVTMTDGTIVTPEGEEITWVHDKVRTQIAGADTEDHDDDGYETTGTSNGVSKDGVFYEREITSPLITYASCFWIMSGVVENTVGDVSYTIDFGDGTCDDVATRTEDGVTEEFTIDFKMKKFRRGHR